MDSATSSWTPTKLWEPLQIWTVGLAIVKISISHVAYDLEMPYFGMDDLGSYAKIILFSFIISIPFGIFRSKRIQVLAFLCADIVLAFANDLIINADYMAWSIAVLLMLMTTVALKLIYNRPQRFISIPAKGKLQYCCYLLVWSMIAYFLEYKLLK